jgi:hypothetical protein
MRNYTFGLAPPSQVRIFGKAVAFLRANGGWEVQVDMRILLKKYYFFGLKRTKVGLIILINIGQDIKL